MDLKGSKITFERVMAVIALLLSFGVFTYVEIAWKNTVKQSVEDVLVDEITSPVTGRKIKEPTDFSKKYIIKPSVDQSLTTIGGLIRDEAAMEAMMQVFEGFKDLKDSELKEYIQSRFEFADQVILALDSLDIDVDDMMVNHKFIKEQKKKLLNGDLSKCGYILKDISTNKPKVFIDCDGDPKKIYFGKPIGRESLKFDVHYYFNEKGVPIIITYLSNIVISQ
jgi:hypothetical protein